MRTLGKSALWVGVVSLAVGVVSRWLGVPIRTVEAHAFLGFAQACFLLSIATSMCSCDKS